MTVDFDDGAGIHLLLVVAILEAFLPVSLELNWDQSSCQLNDNER